MGKPWREAFPEQIEAFRFYFSLTKDICQKSRHRMYCRQLVNKVRVKENPLYYLHVGSNFHTCVSRRTLLAKKFQVLCARPSKAGLKAKWMHKGVHLDGVKAEEAEGPEKTGSPPLCNGLIITVLDILSLQINFFQLTNGLLKCECLTANLHQ